MSRRYVKTSRVGQEGLISPEITAVVSTGNSNQHEAAQQNFFKSNYLDVLKKVVPTFYFSEDQAISGTHISYIDQLLNSYCRIVSNIRDISLVSALEYDNYLSAIDTPEGFAPYFYKQQSIPTLSPAIFEREILYPLGKSFRDYETSSSFINYISGTWLPSIPVATDTPVDLAALTNSAYGTDSSGTHKFLVNSLGWLYFLNRSAPATGNYSPSADLATLITEKLWRGFTIELEDLIGIFQEYIWRNHDAFGLSNIHTSSIIPPDYLSSVARDGVSSTSGTLLLDQLKALNGVVYSPHYLDSNDPIISQTLQNYLNTSSTINLGSVITKTDSKGPFKRFMEAISFGIADRVSETNELGILYDISKCPAEFLEPLSELIGWKLIGPDDGRRRNQLRNAVEIYKSKGTKKSVQTLLDALFSKDVFNITTNSLNELWELYLPDLIYYSLATSSTLFSNFETFTTEKAKSLNMRTYSKTSMDTNLRLAVDQILFELVRTFPNQFYLGGSPFPIPQFYLSGTDEVYEGPYHIEGRQQYMTEAHRSSTSRPIVLRVDGSFTFKYRNRDFWIPPFEKRQYYTQSYINRNLLDKLEDLLICFGTDANYVKKLIALIVELSSGSLDLSRVLNTFLMFSKTKQHAINYDEVISNVTKEKTPDPLDLLSMWCGKSSHFLVILDSSSFDFQSRALDSGSAYGLNKILDVMDQVAPAHAIPEVILNVSAVDDNHPLTANDCREIRPNFYDLYTGSGDVTDNFATSAVNMAMIASLDGKDAANKFRRDEVNNINDVLLSGAPVLPAFQTNFIHNAVRNTLRRRNFRHLLPETQMFTRGGRNNPGSLELSSTYYLSAVGYIPLGFVPSALSFTGVALRDNPYRYKIGQLLDYKKLSKVWDICYNLSSAYDIFGYSVSNTFASRAKQDISSSDCNAYGRRGQLPEILSLMNNINDRKHYLQASSIVSGYYTSAGDLNSKSPSSSLLLSPVDFSAWYANSLTDEAVVRSIGNYLINKSDTSDNIKYYENFEFGRKLHQLYGDYLSTFGQHGSFSNFNLLGGPNIYSHTYGPYIYNSNFEVDGSGIEASGYLQASSALVEVDISYYGGSGVLSVSGGQVGSYGASSPSSIYVGNPEFRNPYLLSAIELVDTSTGFLFMEHPVFSIFRLTKKERNKFNYANFLIDNTLLKYHRNDGKDSFPRVKINIDNSDALKKSRNFLEPDHDYEVQVVAHNINVGGTRAGGLSLGMWVHTQEEGQGTWSYVAADEYCGTAADTWEQSDVSNFESINGEGAVQSTSQIKSFDSFLLEDPLGVGETEDLGGGVVRCTEALPEDEIVPGSNPLAIASLNKTTRQVLTFKLSTYNKGVVPINDYTQKFQQVHRLNQKYGLEFFIPQGSSHQFVVFEEIKIIDLTRKRNAVISTEFGELSLNMDDLRKIFRYFDTLREGIASRDQFTTSAIMEVSGGARNNYRGNIGMFYHLRNAGKNPQLKEIHFGDL